MPKNILFIVPYVPNLIRVRPYNLIRHLTERGNRVTVLTLWTDERERASIQALEPHCEQVIAFHLPRWRSMWNCLAALPSNKPLQTVYCWEPGLAKEMDALTSLTEGPQSFDVVHVEHLRGAAYGLRIRSLLATRKAPLPVVWDSVDSISLLFRQAMTRSKSLLSRSLTRFELGRTEFYEGWLLGQFDRVLVTSQNDKNALRALNSGSQDIPEITVIPNGVDLEYFRPDEQVQREPASLVISGKMSYHANVTMALHFVHEIMPKVWAQRPDARLYVVGKDPSREVLALAQNPQVIVTGTVEHLPPYLQKASVAVAPIAYGAGIQNKVLEAMACAAPVVASPQAVSAIGVQPGQDLLVAQEPADFAAAILSLLENPEYRRQVGQAGRCFVETHHNWDSAAAKLEQVYTQAGAPATGKA